MNKHEPAAILCERAMRSWGDVAKRAPMRVGGAIVTADEANVAAGACEALAVAIRSIRDE